MRGTNWQIDAAEKLDQAVGLGSTPQDEYHGSTRSRGSTPSYAAALQSWLGKRENENGAERE